MAQRTARLMLWSADTQAEQSVPPAKLVETFSCCLPRTSRPHLCWPWMCAVLSELCLSVCLCLTPCPLLQLLFTRVFCKFMAWILTSLRRPTWSTVPRYAYRHGTQLKVVLADSCAGLVLHTSTNRTGMCIHVPESPRGTRDGVETDLTRECCQ